MNKLFIQNLINSYSLKQIYCSRSANIILHKAEKGLKFNLLVKYVSNLQ